MQGDEKSVSVFLVVKYVVKPERQAEFMPCMQRIIKYVQDNPAKFKEWKSFKLFSKMSWDIVGEYMELWGFDNVGDLEKCRKRLAKDKGWQKLMQEIAQHMDPATFQMTTWENII